MKYSVFSRLAVFLSAIPPLVSADNSVVFDDFTWSEIESVEHLSPSLLEPQRIIKVKNDSTVIMPQGLLGWAASSTGAENLDPVLYGHSIYIQSDFSLSDIASLPSRWIPVSLCVDNRLSETNTTLTKTLTVLETVARAVKVHLALLETHLKLKTSLQRAESSAQKAFCEIAPGKVVQVQAKVSRLLVRNALQRTIQLNHGLHRNGHKIDFGAWSVDDGTTYEVGYSLGCITDAKLLKCGD